jgi:hypothetical protein
MDFQLVGGDGTADTIVARRNGLTLELVVNGVVYHSTLQSDVSSLTILGSADRDLITVAGDFGIPVTVDGRGGADELTVTGTTNNDTATITAADVTIALTPTGVPLLTQTITYLDVQILTVNMLGGADVVDVRDSAAATAVTVNASTGNDTITIGSLANQLDGIASLVTIAGGGNTLGGDLLRFYDQGTAAGQGYTLSTVSLVRGTVRIDFGGIERLEMSTSAGGDTVTVSSIGSNVALTLNADGGDDAITVRGAAAGSSLTLDAGDNDDTVELGSTQNNLSSFLGTVTVSGGGQVLKDVLRLHDEGTNTGRTYTLTPGSVTRGTVAFNYGGLEALELNTSGGGDTITVENTATATTINAQGGADTITVRGTAAGGPLTLNAGPAGDTIRIGNAFNRLEDVRGAVTVNGEGHAASDTLTVNDQGARGGKTYSVTSSRVTQGTAVIDYVAVESLELNAGGGSDAVTVERDAQAGTPVTVNAGGGSDYVALAGVADSPTPVTLHGGNGAPTDEDILALTDGRTNTWEITRNNGGVLNGVVTFDAVETLKAGPYDDHFLFADGVGLSGNLNAGPGHDVLDYSAYTTAVTVHLAKGTATGVAGTVDGVEAVFGGSAGDLLVGDGADNVLSGGGGPDVLLGGEGADVLDGGADEDLLIAGTTAHDADDAALAAILAEWTRLDAKYEERIDHLRNGGGLNVVNGAPILLDTRTVFEDSAKDELTGSTELDWFWADFTLSVDLITDLESQEQIN